MRVRPSLASGAAALATRRVLCCAARALVLASVLAGCAATPPEGMRVPVERHAPEVVERSYVPSAPAPPMSQEGRVPLVAAPSSPRMSADQGRALVLGLLPAGIADRAGWARDIFAAFSTLDIEPTPSNACAAIAIVEQESGFRADPAIPGLGRIARKEIEKRRVRAGIPKWMVNAALAVPSSNGKSFGARIDAARTEKDLNAIFEEMIDIVPLGRTLLAERNPVRTAGPMQVSVDFAQAHAATVPYPYPIARSIRDEVFTRRGGVYFGVAHLLDYSPGYDRYIFRFADYNAGRYASRNAAFQHAVTQASGIPLATDGDLLRYGVPSNAPPSASQRALEVLARRLGLDTGDIRRDIALEKSASFSETRTYRRVYAYAERLSGGPLPRAMLPDIELASPKITRKLTTAWFAQRVDERFQACVRRAGG